jgi:DNA-binding transcriptional LysR family regulator
MRDLKDGLVDFVIAYQGLLPPNSTEHSTNAPEPKVDSIVIGNDRLLPVCKPKANGKPMFEIKNSKTEIPFLQFGDNAHIGRLLDPLLEAKGLKPRLQAIYENSMAGALRIRAHDGAGIAWLPKSLVSPDLDNNLLVRTGATDWELELEIRLYRRSDHSNHLTRAIWDYLAARTSRPFILAEAT